MKVEIVSVTKTDCDEVTTNEEFFNQYRRYGLNDWDHFLGENHGWHPYRFTEVLEEAYQEFMRQSNGKGS